jgi:hypothetical protein
MGIWKLWIVISTFLWMCQTLHVWSHKILMLIFVQLCWNIWKNNSYLYWHKYKRVFNYKLQIKGECSYGKLRWWIIFRTKQFVVQKGSCCFFPNIDLFWIVCHENIVHSFHIRYILMYLSIDWCFKEVNIAFKCIKIEWLEDTINIAWFIRTTWEQCVCIFLLQYTHKHNSQHIMKSNNRCSLNVIRSP